jgi:hypothetical protein
VPAPPSISASSVIDEAASEPDTFQFEPTPQAVPPPQTKAPQPEKHTRTTPAPAAPDVAETPPPSQPDRPCCTLRLDPRPIHWLPLACFVLIFILSFFPWVRFAPGGYTLFVQSGWQAAFDGGSEEEDLLNREWAQLASDEDPEEFHKALNVNGFTLLYLLLISFLTLPAALAAPLLPYLPLKLPPAVKPYLPWRAGAVAVLALAGVFLLSLQMFFGFSAENQVRSRIEPRLEKERKALKDQKDSRLVRQRIEMERALFLDSLRRTFWLTLVYLLQIAGMAAAALSLWLELRGRRPPVRLVCYC